MSFVLYPVALYAAWKLTKRTPRSPRVGFPPTWNDDSLAENVKDACENHGRGQTFVFPDSIGGHIQAFYLSTINGDYWRPESIIQVSVKGEEDERRPFSDEKVYYSLFDKIIGSIRTYPDKARSDTTAYTKSLRNDLIHMAEFSPKTDAIHVHLISDTDKLTSEQEESIKDYWKNTFGRRLACIITLPHLSTRPDIMDMRDVIGFNLYEVPVSVSLGRCSIHDAFTAGSTFRQHGRVKSIAYIYFDHMTARELIESGPMYHRPVKRAFV